MPTSKWCWVIKANLGNRTLHVNFLRIENLCQWTNIARKSPVAWCSIGVAWIKHRCGNCYVYAVKTKDINRKNKNSLSYSSMNSAIWPIPHGKELPVSVWLNLLQPIVIPTIPNLFLFPQVIPGQILMTWQEIRIFKKPLRCFLEGVKKNLLYNRVLSSLLTEYVMQNSCHILPKKTRLCAVRNRMFKAFWISLVYVRVWSSTLETFC